MADLTNKVAIVSGGATMIGWKAALALRDGGAKVVLADIAEEEGERVAEELGQDIFFQRTDITDDEQIDACIAATTERFGGVDCLINVACTYLDNGIDSTRDEWLTALNVNLVGAAIFVQKVAPRMRERGGGAVVNFGSISGKRARIWGRRRHDLSSRVASSMALAIPPLFFRGGTTLRRQID